MGGTTIADAAADVIFSFSSSPVVLSNLLIAAAVLSSSRLSSSSINSNSSAFSSASDLAAALLDFGEGDLCAAADVELEEAAADPDVFADFLPLDFFSGFSFDDIPNLFLYYF